MNKKRPLNKKKKRLRLRMNVVGKILLFILVIASFLYYKNNLKIRNINIIGTTNTKDVTIIEKLGIKDYPLIYKLNLKEMQNKTKELPLISEAKIKRNLLGKLTIEVKEDKVLFFYKYKGKFVTTSNKLIEPTDEYYGYPTLINFTPDTIFNKFVESLNKIDYDIIRMINEIEYTPYKNKDGKIIDDSRFTLKMNDTNTVYTDTVNIKNLNKYKTIYASPGMDTERGYIYLDSHDNGRILFQSYASVEQAKKEEAKKETKK